MRPFKALTVFDDGAVRLILLNRARALNAFDRELRAELLLALRETSGLLEPRVLILGTEGRVFSAGADLREDLLEGQSCERQLLDEYAPIFDVLSGIEQPVIAAVPGTAAGIAAALVMHCDLVVMAQSARLLFAFSNIGLVPDGGSSWHLLRRIGYARSFEVLIEGGQFDAPRCLELGIANRVVTDAELLPSALNWAHQLAGRPSLAAAGIKRLLREAAQQAYVDTFALEARLQDDCLNSNDAHKARQDFIEKRKPALIPKQQ